VSRADAFFNDEHVIPDWILKRYGLHSQEIGFNVNQAGQLYGRFRVPCCKNCNGLMADTFETPISRLVSAGHPAVLEHLKSNGPMIFFQWLTLIFFKVHYRDKTLRLHLDTRKGTEMVGDLIDWIELHHIHCVARVFYTGAHLDVTALGSFRLLQARQPDFIGPFDYADLTEAQTMLLRLGDMAFLAVLNDSFAAWNVISDSLTNITAAPSGVQLREVMVRMAWINLRLEERPAFSSDFRAADESLTIRAQHGEDIALREPDLNEFGALMYSTFRDVIDTMPQLNTAETRQHIQSGRWTFLFRPDGAFESKSI
jgi:hypothetical protein